MKNSLKNYHEYAVYAPVENEELKALAQDDAVGRVALNAFLRYRCVSERSQKALSNLRKSQPATYDVFLNIIRQDFNARLPRGIERRLNLGKEPSYNDLRSLGYLVVNAIKNALKPVLNTK